MQVRTTSEASVLFGGQRSDESQNVPPQHTPEGHAAQPAERQQKIKKDAVLEKYHFFCAFGPKDESENLPTADSTQRRNLTKHGEGCKRGCQAHFSVTVRAKTPEIAELRIYHKDHLNVKGVPCHGPECNAPGRHHTQPHLSKECKELVEAQLLAGISYNAILQHNRAKFHRQHQHQHNLESVQAAQREMEVRVDLPKG